MNYYEILEVSKNASSAQIKSSYKKLVKKYHPDLYKGDKYFEELPFTKFVTEKIEHLTKKRQIQIFFLIFAITLFLFFISLWQLNRYLTSHSEPTLRPKSPANKSTFHHTFDEHHNL